MLIALYFFNIWLTTFLSLRIFVFCKLSLYKKTLALFMSVKKALSASQCFARLCLYLHSSVQLF